MSHKRKHPILSPRGFTLVEILMAIIIMAVILVTVYGSVARTLTSKERAESRAELFATGREAVQRIADEVQASVSPLPRRGVFRGARGGGSPPTDSIAFVAMNRGGYGLNRVPPGLVLIQYAVSPVEGRRGLFTLWREEERWAALLAEADGQPLPADDPDLMGGAPLREQLPLLDCPADAAAELPGSCVPVLGLQFRYFDDRGGVHEEWDSLADATRFMLPSAVQITLYLGDERRAVHDFSTVVDLPIARGQPTPRADGSVDPDAGATAETSSSGGATRGERDFDADW